MRYLEQQHAKIIFWFRFLLVIDKLLAILNIYQVVQWIDWEKFVGWTLIQNIWTLFQHLILYLWTHGLAKMFSEKKSELQNIYCLNFCFKVRLKKSKFVWLKTFCPGNKAKSFYSLKQITNFNLYPNLLKRFMLYGYV